MIHIVRGLEVSSPRRRHTQRSEVVGAYSLAIEPFRLICARKSGLPRLHYGDRVEGTAPLLQFAKGMEGLGDAGTVVSCIPEHDDPAGLRVRQRLEQDWIDCAKDGRRSADAEG